MGGNTGISADGCFRGMLGMSKALVSFMDGSFI